MIYKRKKLVFLLLISISNYIGCYSYQAVSKEEFLSAKDKDASIRIDYKHTYLFSEGDYSINNDTLSGNGKLKGLKQSYEIYHDFEGDLALSDIKEIKLKKIDTTLTIATIVIPVGVLVWLKYYFFKSGI